MLFEIQKPQLTPLLVYFKQHFSTSEVFLQQTGKHVLYFLNNYIYNAYDSTLPEVFKSGQPQTEEGD